MDCEELTFGSIQEKTSSSGQVLEKMYKSAEGVVSTGNENCVISIFNVSKWVCE